MTTLRTLLFAGSAAALLSMGCTADEGKTDEADTDTDTDADSDADTDSDTDTDTYDRYAQDATNARVRLTHAMADVGGIDIVLGAGPAALVEDIPFPGSVPYAPFPPGTYDIHINSTGTTDDLVFLEGIEASADTYYTLLLYGTLTGGAILPALGPMGMVLEDDHSEPTAGMARVKLVNIAGTTATAAGAAGASVWEGTTELWADLDYGMAGDDIEIAAGAHTWGVDYTADDTADVSFTFSVADGDTASVYMLPGDTTAGQPAVSVLFLHHTTSTAPDEDDTFFDDFDAIQVMPVYPDSQ